MHPFSIEHLEAIWAPEDAKLSGRYLTHVARLDDLDLGRVGVIGRDLILRREALFEPKFYLAALLATERLTGHDGFLDFSDSVAVLPPERFDLITSDPNNLLDDAITGTFEELGFVRAVEDQFDVLAGLEAGDGMLRYLVLGPDEDSPWPRMQAEATPANAEKWLPRLFQRSGHILSEP